MNVEKWDYGHAIPFLGIFVSNFRPWFFAVYSVHSDVFLQDYSLKGLSHEIDFKNVDNNLQNLA
jgi:hypothetical protein